MEYKYNNIAVFYLHKNKKLNILHSVRKNYSRIKQFESNWLKWCILWFSKMCIYISFLFFMQVCCQDDIYTYMLSFFFSNNLSALHNTTHVEQYEVPTRIIEFISGGVTCLARSIAPRTCCWCYTQKHTHTFISAGKIKHSKQKPTKTLFSVSKQPNSTFMSLMRLSVIIESVINKSHSLTSWDR